MLTLRDYEDAVLIQDACNLSGVIHSYSRVVTEVRHDLESRNVCGTKAIAQHPICILYASKIYSLTFGGCVCNPCMKTFGEAYEAIRNEIERHKE